MNVLLFGATGKVGDGVLHECLAEQRTGHSTHVLENTDINALAAREDV